MKKIVYTGPETEMPFAIGLQAFTAEIQQSS